MRCSDRAAAELAARQAIRHAHTGQPDPLVLILLEAGVQEGIPMDRALRRITTEWLPTQA